MKVTVIGDALLDRNWTGRPTALCPDSAAPVVTLHEAHARAGGAALTAAAATALGADVVLVTAIGRDAAGDDLRAGLAEAGLTVVDLGTDGPTPEKIRVRSAGATVVRLDRGCDRVVRSGPWSEAAARAICDADAVLLSDYGRGLVHRSELTTALGPRDVPVVWDPHRSSRLPNPHVTLATPSESEADELAARLDGNMGIGPDEIARQLACAWRCVVAVTCGSAPIRWSDGGPATPVPVDVVEGDPCGAGDWFAAGATVSLASGSTIDGAIRAGRAAAHRWIEHGGAAAPSRRERVVATSGCFDVLHAGHIALLHHARGRGDRLVVLLNSDASVRRLKGPGRPVNSERDRRALLAALEVVDEVRIFDESTPCRALGQLRPDVFVKGADYEGVDIPERAVLAEWGGIVAFAPLVPNRSTTRVLQLARRLTG